MKDLAPNILRQRLVVEGFYNIDVDESKIKEFFDFITSKLEVRPYGEPIIFSPGGDGKEENQGYDAFVPLIDSGISLYVWTNSKFVSLIIYTCKSFDNEKAIQATKEFFDIKETASMDF